MINIQRILLPTDFSDSAEQAKKYASALVGKFDAELHVLHVLPDLSTGLYEYPVPEWSNEYLEQAEAAVMQRLNQLVGSEWSAQHRVVSATRRGVAFNQIIDYAWEHEIDVIVMGTHGRTGLPHMLIGSVAERVVRRAPCPVLTVHPTGHQFVMP